MDLDFFTFLFPPPFKLLDAKSKYFDIIILDNEIFLSVKSFNLSINNFVFIDFIFILFKNVSKSYI